MPVSTLDLYEEEHNKALEHTYDHTPVPFESAPTIAFPFDRLATTLPQSRHLDQSGLAAFTQQLQPSPRRGTFSAWRRTLGEQGKNFAKFMVSICFEDMGTSQTLTSNRLA